ncbi:glycosyltransferase family 2 protein [Verrucomicrobiales bacterium]|nr:glycosyltransferase family 2 protein [Verrucomicrobiales bacterium]MDC0275396.1 glycosyltransferase family 2 protein [Verrucomicrobiales bacterium]
MQYIDRLGVSVIIPCYNESGYVSRAIRSVLDQDYALVEIIVIDDGSTDTTRAIVENFGNVVRYIYQSKSGVSIARNQGVNLASHPLVFFLDADDWLLPHALSTMVSTMAKHGGSCVLVGSSSFYGNRPPEKKCKNYIEPIFEDFITGSDLILKNRMPCANLVNRKAFLKAGGFDPEMTHSEDRDLWIRMAAQGTLCRISSELLVIEIREGSASRNTKKMKQGMKEVLKKSRSSQVIPNISYFEWRQAHAVLHYQVSTMHSEQRNSKMALFELILSGLHCPFIQRSRLPKFSRFFRLRRGAVLIKRLLNNLYSD